jgi:hypothetical protein
MSNSQNKTIVAGKILFELEDGIPNGRGDAERLGDWSQLAWFGATTLGEAGKPIFEELTIGISIETLGKP